MVGIGHRTLSPRLLEGVRGSRHSHDSTPLESLIRDCPRVAQQNEPPLAMDSDRHECHLELSLLEAQSPLVGLGKPP